MRYFNHITLMTGHSIRQYRDAVSDDAVEAVSEMLDSILQGGHPALQVPGYLASGTHYGSALVVTVWAGPWAERSPILTTGVALKSRAALRVWEGLHAHPEALVAPLATSPAAPPPAPGAADRIEAGALRHLDAMAWTEDWSRCLAWAWAEYARPEREA